MEEITILYNTENIVVRFIRKSNDEEDESWSQLEHLRNRDGRWTAKTIRLPKDKWEQLAHLILNAAP